MKLIRAGRLGATFLLLSCLGNNYYVPAQTQPSRATVKIDATKSPGRISPLLYGQFMEFMFEGVKFGLHAELLRNRSFEEQPSVIGLSRYWERYPDDRNDDYGLNFNWDATSHYPEKMDPDAGLVAHATRIDVGEGVIKRHGIFQGRIPVRAGLDYDAYVWLKATDFRGTVSVALEADTDDGKTYAQSAADKVGTEWRRYQFRLRPSAGDPNARFVILLAGRGRVWLDQASLMPGDAVQGVRADVVKAVKTLRPAFIRWPGGNVAQDYRWFWGVGPRDERQGWVNLSWKNELESGDFGTAEFIQFSRNVGAEPSLTVNVEGRGATVEEAAHWVEYCNGAVTTKYGRLRAEHGYPEPFNVKLWEIGNEIWGAWVRGHSDAATYARNLNRYVAAMRAVDPGIKIIAVGDNDLNWDRTVLQTAGPNIDYLAVHHYYGRHEMAGDVENLMARPLFLERFYKTLGGLIQESNPRHEVQVAVNEWGLDLPLEQQYSMLSALYGARLMNVFERTNGLVGMSAVSDMINGWPGGIIQAGRDGLFVSPVYLVNQLYSESLGGAVLASEVSGPTFDSTKEGKQVPQLDVVASRSADNKNLFVKVVNTNLTDAVTTTIEVLGATIEKSAELSTVNGTSLASFNSFATPAAVRLNRTPVVAGRQFSVTLAPHSVNVLRLAFAR